MRTALMFGAALLVCFHGGLQSAEECSVVRTGSSLFHALDSDGVLLTMDTVSFKPNWGWMGISRATAKEVGRGASFDYTQDRGALKWSIGMKPAGNKLTVDVGITATADCELQYLAFAFAPGDALRGGNLLIQGADAEPIVMAIPIQKAGPTNVTGLTFVDKQGKQVVKIDFAKPASLHVDGNVRVRIVEEDMAKGQTLANTFNLTFTSPVALYTDGSKLPPYTDHSDWFAFTPKNTGEAGAIGMQDWLKLPAQPIQVKGDALIADGKPFKVWGTNVEYAATAPDKADAEARAAFFAKFGINGVRLHKLTNPGWEGLGSKTSASVYDPATLARFDYFTHQLRERGITYGFSPIWDLKIFAGDRDKLVAYDEIVKAGGRSPSTKGLVWFAKDVQDLHIETMLNLLNHKNPHSELRYAEDPALSYIEIQNEEDVFFYTTEPSVRRHPTYRKMVAEQFSDWLKAKYASQEALANAWGKDAINTFRTEGGLPDEHLDKRNIAPVSNPWMWDNQGKDHPRAKRLQDTALFLLASQNNYYGRMVEAVRKAGFRAAIVGSNWQAGSKTGHFLNLKSDAETGMIDRHNYMGGALGNPAHEMHSGHRLANRTMLGDPGSGLLSVGMQQIKDRPFVFSEWLAVPPVEWAASDTTIIAAYGFGLQGWDMSYHFASNGNGFSPRLQHPGNKKFNNLTPVGVGLYPALSRMVLRGDVQPGKVIATRRLTVQQATEQTYNFTNETTQAHDVKSFSGTLHHSALAAGRVLVEFPKKEAPSTIDDWAATSRRDGTIVSTTRQLRWTAGAAKEQTGHIAIDTPGTQGVAGFTGQMEFAFGDLTLETKSPYGVILTTAKSRTGTLATDKQVLIVAVARAHNTDMNMGVGMIFDVGKAPVILEPVRAAMQFKRKVGTVTVLDHDGMPTGTTYALKDGRFDLDTARDKTLYFLVTFP
jgi:hypothetical protein